MWTLQYTDTLAFLITNSTPKQKAHHCHLQMSIVVHMREINKLKYWGSGTLRNWRLMNIASFNFSKMTTWFNAYFSGSWINILLWYTTLTNCSDILLWNTSLIYYSDILLRHTALIYYPDILPWYTTLIYCSDIPHYNELNKYRIEFVIHYRYQITEEKPIQS